MLRLDPEQQQEGVEEDESLMLGLFLDFLSRQVLTSDPGPVLYSEAMAEVRRFKQELDPQWPAQRPGSARSLPPVLPPL